VQYIIDAPYDGVMLKQYLCDALGLSRRLLTRLKQHPSGILLDGRRVTVRATLHAGAVLTLAFEDTPDTKSGIIVPSATLPDILYEDEDILVCNKPFGMPTHPSHGHFDDTIGNFPLWHYQQNGEECDFHPVHRLDKGTTGLLVVAKSG